MNDIIFNYLFSFAHQSVFTDKVITFIAEPFAIMVLMIGGLYILFHHEIFKAENPYQVIRTKGGEIFKVALSLGVAYLSSYILKLFFAAARPFESMPFITPVFGETGHAFPSSHAAVFSALAFSIFFLHKKAGMVFMVLALFIGMARIVAGVHFPIDILGGFVLGALVAYLVKKA